MQTGYFYSFHLTTCPIAPCFWAQLQEKDVLEEQKPVHSTLLPFFFYIALCVYSGHTPRGGGRAGEGGEGGEGVEGGGE